MPFEKGDKNINRLGRPIGSKNRLYATRRFIFNLLENNRDKLMIELDSLHGEKYVYRTDRDWETYLCSYLLFQTA